MEKMDLDGLVYVNLTGSNAITMDEHSLIKAGIMEIFSDNGFADSSAMTQRDFDHISEQLRQKSGILISGTTIKRLVYGEFSRQPQIATLNAIANYFDYKTWPDYKADKLRNAQAGTPAHDPTTEPRSKTVKAIASEPGETLPTEPVDDPEIKRVGRESKRIGAAAKRIRSKSTLTILKYLSVPLVLVIIGSLYFFGTSKAPIGHADKATFSFKKNTSNDIPNSVVFSYNVDSVKADSFFIQQSWDANRRVRIYKGQHTLTDIYYEPGCHMARLIANDSAIRTVDVSLPTQGWFFYAIDNAPRYTPEYIRTDRFINQGSLVLGVDQLLENRIDISKGKRYHYVYFPSRMDVPSDNFRFKTRVRMKEVRLTTCPYIELELFCQRAFMVMRSTTNGCAHEAFIAFGEQVFRGKDHDLLPIAFDVSQWTDIEITVNNKVVTISINGKAVYTTRFTKDTKLLTGIGYISNGLMEVDDVELAGLDGKVMYKNDFEKSQP